MLSASATLKQSSISSLIKIQCNAREYSVEQPPEQKRLMLPTRKHVYTPAEVEKKTRPPVYRVNSSLSLLHLKSRTYTWPGFQRRLLADALRWPPESKELHHVNTRSIPDPGQKWPTSREPILMSFSGRREAARWLPVPISWLMLWGCVSAG